ncbi:hypothetical protein SK128_017616, partial [Halocaridina rubra]
YDARLHDFSDGDRWSESENLGGRAFFSAVSEPPSLILDPLRSSDEGIYTCRIDYKRSPSTTSSSNLTVVVPPAPPVVLWEGVGVVGGVGPIRENAEVILTCRSSGGRPPPALTWWWRGTRLSHQTSKLTINPLSGTALVESTLRLRATRGLQGAVLTCHAHPPTPKKAYRHLLLQPRTASVSLNITLPPLEVDIYGVVGPVSAGSVVQPRCQTIGSNPPAKITWWRGHTHLTQVTHSVEDGGNITTATLTLITGREHDGVTLACTAVNPSLPDVPITRTVKLEVLYPPVATLTLGRVLNSSNIKEGDDIFFECSVKANPFVQKIKWYHNGAVMQHDVNEGVVMSGLSLALQRLRRKHSGSYVCVAYNNEGQNTSNTFHLTVKHAPECVGGAHQKTIGAARGSATQLTCRVEAEPAVNIRWEWVKIQADKSEVRIPREDINSDGLTSSIVLTPLTQGDYGQVFCRASNVIGRQREACVLRLVPAGPPDSPINCTATPLVQADVSSSSVSITCHEGFDGGLPQEFLLEASQNEEIIANFTSEFPEWVVDGLQEGTSITVRVLAQNARGRSETTRLEVHTPIAQHIEALDGSHDPHGNLLGAPTLLGALVGVMVVLVLLIVLSVVLVRYARPRPKNKSDLNQIAMSPTPASSSWECYNPDLVSSVNHRLPSHETLAISQQNIPSPRLHSLMQRHMSSCTLLHGQLQHHTSKLGQSVPQILINSLPQSIALNEQSLDNDGQDSTCDSSSDSDVQSVIEVTSSIERPNLQIGEKKIKHDETLPQYKNPMIKKFSQPSSNHRKPLQDTLKENEAMMPLLTKENTHLVSPIVVKNLSCQPVPNHNPKVLPKTSKNNIIHEENSSNDQLSEEHSLKRDKEHLETEPPPKPPRAFCGTPDITPSPSPACHKKPNISEVESPEDSLGDLELAPLAEDEVNGAYKDTEALRKHQMNGIAEIAAHGKETTI